MKNTIKRKVIVDMGLCGHNSLFIGRMGDWIWKSVEKITGVNVSRAMTKENIPSYLAYIYFQIQGGSELHLKNLIPDDNLEIVTSIYGIDEESILSLSRISYEGKSAGEKPVTLEELIEEPIPDAMYFQTLNRWISRQDQSSNEKLFKSNNS